MAWLASYTNIIYLFFYLVFLDGLLLLVINLVLYHQGYLTLLLIFYSNCGNLYTGLHHITHKGGFLQEHL